ncbi:MAG TPA: MBL fold metallo-hydrolase [Chloroflexi bacterium]|nr:MBL fold metallo-hydrolase [Chloroflexota bacterium]
MDQMTITVDALREMLEEGQPVTVLDIRPATERAEWSIPHSLHVDAYDALQAGDPNALKEIDLPAGHLVVTVCGAGKTSLIAAQQLRMRGLDAASLTGGMKAWSLAWNIAEILLPASEARVIQVRRTGKGCLSYLIGAANVAVVVDPALEPEVYLALARRYGWTITGVLETHIHADHLSRARPLCERSGATHYVPDQRRVAFPFRAVREGDVVEIGPARLVALHTPGHTPESTSYLLDDQALLTGDTLFVAGVGRPDLEATSDEARTRARMLYHSLHRLLALGPAIRILPGHTGEPVAFDRKAVAASLAEVRERVGLLHLPEETFVESLMARIPPTPPNHHQIVPLNEAGLMPVKDPTDLEAGANRCAIG